MADTDSGTKPPGTVARRTTRTDADRDAATPPAQRRSTADQEYEYFVGRPRPTKSKTKGDT